MNRMGFIFNLFLAMMISSLQISFVSNLPSWLFFVDIVSIFLSLVLFILDLEEVLFWSIIFGFFLSIYSFVPFVAVTFSLFASAYLSGVVLKNVLTNRSVYSFLALVAVFVLIKRFFEFLLVNSVDFILVKDFSYRYFGYRDFIKTELITLFFAFLVFYLVNYWSNKMKPFFLEKKNIF